MTIEEISERLGGVRDRLSELGVARIFLIGSRARGDAGESSDYDFVIDFEKPATIDNYLALQDLLTEICSTSVDLMTLQYIRSDKKPYIMAEARQVA